MIIVTVLNPWLIQVILKLPLPWSTRGCPAKYGHLQTPNEQFAEGGKSEIKHKKGFCIKCVPVECYAYWLSNSVSLVQTPAK